MSAGKENSPDSMEHACMLCLRVEADPNICGRKLERKGICAHEFCVYFANELFQKCMEDSGFMGFVPEDIRCIIEWAEEKDCFVCGESGATITCEEMGCERNFHLPCAMEGGCITQYFGGYRSFCWEHRPEQAVEAAPGEDTVCPICLDPVEDKKSYTTMVCPACKHAWFHRGCIQGQALNAGIYCFQCPLCRNRSAFLLEMLTMGIRIPLSLPSWEESMANTALNERRRRCDARKCFYPGGREQEEQEGPWQLLLCSSCGAEGTHRRCSSVSSSQPSWECDSCAGLGTASSASSQIAGPSTASQAGAGPSCGSPIPETSSPNTGSQGTSRPSHSSPALESGSGSSTPGTERFRNHSRLQHRALIPYSRSRRCPESSHEQTPRSQTSAPSQAQAGPSPSSLSLETTSPSTSSQLPSGSSSAAPSVESGSCSSPSGPMRVRDRSRIPRQAQTPYSRPRRCHARSRAPGSSEESSAPSQVVHGSSHRSPTVNTRSPSTTRQLPSGSSPELQSSRCSRTSGPVRATESSRVLRRAQNPYSRRRRHHQSSRAQSQRAGP